jgi:hypothetical protein
VQLESQVGSIGSLVAAAEGKCPHHLARADDQSPYGRHPDGSTFRSNTQAQCDEME